MKHFMKHRVKYLILGKILFDVTVATWLYSITTVKTYYAETETEHVMQYNVKIGSFWNLDYFVTSSKN